MAKIWRKIATSGHSAFDSFKWRFNNLLIATIVQGDVAAKAKRGLEKTEGHKQNRKQGLHRVT